MSDCTIVMKCGSADTLVSGHQYQPDASTLLLLRKCIDIEQAEATVPSDKERILFEIREANPAGGLIAVNHTIRGVLTGAVHANAQPLIQCAACGDPGALKTLFDDPDTYIASVAGCGYIDVLREMLKFLKDGDNKKTLHHPLVAAAKAGHVACVELLIESGADVTVQLRSTALIEAASMGEAPCVGVLLSHGSSVTAVDADGMTALIHAAKAGSTACIDMLITTGSDLNYGDKSESGSSYGRTALMWAAGQGHTDCVYLLLDRGSNISIKDYGGMTALMLAARGNHSACVELLKRAAAADRSSCVVS